MKTVRVILSTEAEIEYNLLVEQSEHSKVARSILNAVENKKRLIRANPQYGEPIPKKQIPADYIAKYGVNNLFWVGLPDYWRMIYTLTANGEVEIIAFVLDIIDHKKYNKKFGYR
ncbi:MAG: hypothetical protein NTV88_02135 [Candidatus Micrarchaeota archaeon]|nr:hypothetical protein [Candidatus Micrarchaeota archaeon]